MNTATVHGIVEKHGTGNGGLIAILEEVQSKYGYLPREALEAVSRETGQSLVDIYGVATFYRAFSLEPRGEHLVSVCMGTACHVRGAPAVAEEFSRLLGVAPGRTTDDRKYTLETVNCLGACALGPIVVVDGHYFSKVRPPRVRRILDQAEAGFESAGASQSGFPVRVSCSRCNHSLMDEARPLDGHPSIRVTVSFADHHGWLRLSGVWGSYAVESEEPIPADTVVQFFCPHCHAELAGAAACPDCGAPMVPLIVQGGGMAQICSRRGCRGHRLDLNGVNL